MRFKKAIFIVTGFISLGLGAVGAAVPMIPSVPFLMLAACCFAKSSNRLHNWFTGTKLYKNNLESYVAGKGMTKETKRRIMVTVTLLMGFGFGMMMRKALYMPCMIMGCVWVLHIFYFIFFVKTLQLEQEQAKKVAS